MRLARGLHARVALVALVAGGAGVLVSIGSVVPSAQQYGLKLLDHHLRTVETQRALSRCDGNPQRWSFEDYYGIRYRAYTAGGRPLGGDHSLSPTLLRRVRAGDPKGSESGLGEVRAFVSRPGRPCAVVEASFSGLKQIARLSGPWLPLTAMSIFAVVVMGVVHLVVRPLRARIARMRTGATAIGDASGYRRLESGGGDELGELERSIDRAHDRTRADVVEIDRRRTQIEHFVDDIAHDLRTPLTALSLALEELDDKVPRQYAVATQDAMRETRYIAALVENLRLASRLDEGWNPILTSPSTDLRAVVERVGARESILARRAGVRLQVELPRRPVGVSVNATLTEQAVTNLVQNAVSYTDARADVTVRLVGDDHEAFTLYVIDEGPGIAQEQLQWVAQRGRRLDRARRRDPRGSGLGLSIVASLCEQAGWTLRFEPTQPRGLTTIISASARRRDASPQACGARRV